MARAPQHEQGFNGRKGNKVYYTVNGVTYIREYVVPNHSDPSELQTETWNRFQIANHFVKPLKPVFRLGFVNFQKGMLSQANVGLKTLLHTAFREGEALPDPTKLEVSAGHLTGMENGRAEWKDAHTVTVRWDNNAGEGSAANRDRVSLLLYNTDRKRSFHLLEANPRSKEEQDINIPHPEKHRGKLHVYAFFTFKNPRNGKYQVSATAYLGLI